ncbi:hypothetical protein LTR87_011679 [Friedmanniomyces endolithicus]|nr:hypothetical protein LTR87_011679 [Friedmanniomyces endolithicus]
MATPPLDGLEAEKSSSSPPLLGKRKRESDEDSDNKNNAENTLFIPDENDMSLLVYGNKVAGNNDPHHGNDEDEEEDEVDDDDESADDALDDDQDDQDVHMESAEPFPGHAIYDKAIPAIKAKLTDIAKEVVAVLQPHTNGGNYVTTHLDAASVLMTVPSTKRLRVAFIGNAGVGKSSTLNAITDIANLAKSLASGMSCTNLPTEYRNPFPGQIKPYAAIIRYHSCDGIRRLLIEYTKDYYLYEFEADEDWDRETRQDVQKRSKTAFNTLQMLFRDLPEFRNRQAAKQYLDDHYQDPSGDALKCMYAACIKMLRAKAIEDGAYSESYQAASVARLRKQIDPVMGSVSSSDQPALWPLVRHIAIGVQGSRVLDVMTLIDLPGHSDTNESRVEFVKEYIKTCDHIWAVATIGRAVDDNALFNTVHRYGKLFNGRIMVLVTHSDANVDHDLVADLRAKGLDMQAWYKLNNDHKQLSKNIKQLDDANKLARRKKHRQSKSTLLDMHNKEEELDAMRKALESIVLSRYQFSVQARNQWVTEQIRETMEGTLPKGATLAVHCISTAHYAAIKAGRSVEGPRLTPEATGVPALRAYALALAAPELMQSLEQYCSEDLNVFFKNARLWIKTTHVERRAEILRLAQVPLNKLEGRVEARVAAFKDGIKSGLVNALHEQFATTRDTALKVLNRKREVHSSTVCAFIRKHGNHTSRLGIEESWNEQFVKTVTELVDQHWEAFENSRTQISDQFRDVLIQDMRNILPEMAQEHPLGSKALPTVELAGVIDAQVGALNNVFRNSMYPYSQDLRNIRMDVTQDSNMNYFSRTILPAYQECALDTGPGVTKRHLDRLQVHLSKPQSESPFTSVERSFTAALIKNDGKHTSTGENSVKKGVETIFKSLYAAFNRSIDRTIEEPQEKAGREALQKVLRDLENEYREAKNMLKIVKGRYTD